MKNKFLFFVILILQISCDSEWERVNCKYHIEGVCYSIQDNQEVSYVRLVDSMLKLQELMNQRNYNFYWSRSLTSKAYSLVHYVNVSDWQHPDLRGYTLDSNSFVKYDPEICVNRVYVAMHELMHQIARVHLNLQREANADHNLQGFFLESLGDDSVEFELYHYIWFSVCEMDEN